MSQPPGEGAAGYNEAHVDATGVRFVPSDREIVNHYLQRKLRGEPLPADVVNDGDVYAEHPKNLVRRLGKSLVGCWYLFSPRDRKYGKGERPRRSTDDGAGFWKSINAKEEIHGADGKVVIGHKCRLTFHEYVPDEPDVEKQQQGRRKRRRKGKPTEWKMLEFISVNSDRPIDTTAPNHMLLNDCVLCKITNKLMVVEEETDLGLSQSMEEEEQQTATPDGCGESQDKEPLPEQQQSASNEGAGPQDEQQHAASDGPHDEQQQATPQARSEGDTAAAALQQTAPNDDFYNVAKIIDEPLNWWLDYFDTDGGAERHEQPAEQKQETPGSGAGSQPQGEEQATPEATNEGAPANAEQEAKRWGGGLQNCNRPYSNSLFDFDDRSRATS